MGHTTLTEWSKDIADAVRFKEDSTNPIPRLDIPQRILDLPTGSGGVGQMVRYSDFLTPQEESDESVLRCDGRELSPTYTELYDLLKHGLEIEGLPSRAHNNIIRSGDKLYIGSTGLSTFIVVVNIKNNTFSSIEGLPNRAHSQFYVVGSKIYVASQTANITNMVVINTINDTFSLIEGLPSRSKQNLELFGHKLFIGTTPGNTSTNASYIDIRTDMAMLVQGLPNSVYFGYHRVGHLAYVHNSIASTFLIVINTENDTFMQITNLPSRSYTRSIQYGPELYAMENNIVAQSSIVVINLSTHLFFTIDNIVPRTARLGGVFENKIITAGFPGSTDINIVDGITHEVTTINGLPSRSYQYFFSHITSRKIYLGTSTDGDTIVIVHPDNGTFSEIIGLPNRQYRQFHFYENIAFVSSATNGTSLIVINTDNDTFTEISGLPNRAYSELMLLDDRLYAGGTTVADSLVFIRDILLPNYSEPVYIKHQKGQVI